MNEKIKSLAEQAGIKINEGQETHLWWLERFAELVRQDERKKWIGLTNYEVDAIRNDIFQKYQKALLVTRDVTSENDYSAFNFYRAIEDKLRSKNDI